MAFFIFLALLLSTSLSFTASLLTSRPILQWLLKPLTALLFKLNHGTDQLVFQRKWQDHLNEKHYFGGACLPWRSIRCWLQDGQQRDVAGPSRMLSLMICEVVKVIDTKNVAISNLKAELSDLKHNVDVILAKLSVSEHRSFWWPVWTIRFPFLPLTLNTQSCGPLFPMLYCICVVYGDFTMLCVFQCKWQRRARSF